MLDWLNYLNSFILFWWPWINLINEVFFIQFLLVYILYIIYSTNNFYFVLFYIFIYFIYIGIFLSLYNLELFTAFLWLTECVIVFVSVLLLFYINVYGNLNKNNNIINSFKYYNIYLIFFIFILVLSIPSNFENYIFIFNNIYYYWDNYYEALYNNKMNDLFGLYISYYYINSFELLILGFILLIASLVCVNINKFNRQIKSNNYQSFLSLFDFFEDFSKFFFLRKQNLTDQNLSNPSTRIFKKKNKN